MHNTPPFAGSKSLAQAISLGEAVSGSFFRADWPAPPNVKTLITTRNGGSTGAYRSLNAGAHVGDDARCVAENRARIQAQIPVPVAYLNQIHGTAAVRAAEHTDAPPQADASFDDTGRAACAVMTADCLPVLFCDRAGSVVAAAHAGWRGLAGGILQNTCTSVVRCSASLSTTTMGLALSATGTMAGRRAALVGRMGAKSASIRLAVRATSTSPTTITAWFWG